MEYYKVQPNILNFLPNIRFVRDMREHAVTTPMSRNMNRRKLSSQTKNAMQGVYSIDGNGSKTLQASDADITSKNRYKFPILGQKHRRLLLRIDETLNSNQAKEKNTLIRDLMDQILHNLSADGNSESMKQREKSATSISKNETLISNTIAN